MAGDPLGYLATINGAQPNEDMAASNQQFATQMMQNQPQPPPTDPTGAAAQAAQQIGQTPPAQGVGGTLKHLLSSYFVNVGSKLAGVMTPEQRQQRDFNNQLQLGQLASMDKLRQTQEQANQLVPFQMPGGQVVMVPAAHAATLGAAIYRSDASKSIAQTKASSVLDAIRAKGLLPPKPTTTTEYSLALAAAQGDETAKAALDLLAAEKAKKKSDANPSPGTWTLQEGPDGKTVLFNTKTTEMKPAPPGMQPKGTQAKADADYNKTVAPALAAADYAHAYLDRGAFDGPGDEALMEKYFELAAPTRGFRMTAPQMNMLTELQSLKNRAKATWGKLTGGTMFSPDQRAKIVATMDSLAKSKAAFAKQSPSSGSPNSDPFAQFGGKSR